MLILQNINYCHPNKDLLFEDLSLNISKQNKIALIGNNGVGKSSLLKIIAGILQPTTGLVRTNSAPYYVPQLFGQFNEFTIAQALRIDGKLKALQEILGGQVTETNLAILNDDWTLEERCQQALKYWKLDGFDLTQKMKTLSGGQKTKVFLAGISIHQPEIVLLTSRVIIWIKQAGNYFMILFKPRPAR
jgi:ATPase subunit of ABC transporter with duplicated ATPase domains